MRALDESDTDKWAMRERNTFTTRGIEGCNRLSSGFHGQWGLQKPRNFISGVLPENDILPRGRKKKEQKRIKRVKQAQQVLNPRINIYTFSLKTVVTYIVLCSKQHLYQELELDLYLKPTTTTLTLSPLPLAIASSASTAAASSNRFSTFLPSGMSLSSWLSRPSLPALEKRESLITRPAKHRFATWHANSLLMTSQSPSLASIKNSSELVRLITCTSGSGITYGFR
ncbi:methionine aminopeptidase 1C [Striga asiatica]|uniref:Methionine aminopeptidase 1C n=1 Tax=Striga asiatica TaxID=4170 RepID=A0A5A7PN49_STRAF|nr:methionine aminopeptidase 1C [Striga asiatica]